MINIRVDFGRIPQKVTESMKFGQFVLDNAVLRDSNYYIPMDTGNLQDSGVLHSKIGEGEVAWRTPYARRLYYNPQYNFSRDRNPNAQGLWFEVSKAQNLRNWLNESDKAVKSRL